MKSFWDELISILAEIAECYVRLVELAKEKREILVSVKVNSLSQLIEKEESIIKEISVLEEKRQVLVEQLARQNSWTDEKIKLFDLVERAPAEFAPQMKATGQRLADIVMEIALLNGVNNNLLKQGMKIIEYNINILSQAQATPFYGADGIQPFTGKGTAGLSVFDRKA